MLVMYTASSCDYNFQFPLVNVSQSVCISCLFVQTFTLRSQKTACSGQFQFSLKTNAHHGSLCNDILWSGRATASFSTAPHHSWPLHVFWAVQTVVLGAYMTVNLTSFSVQHLIQLFVTWWRWLKARSLLTRANCPNWFVPDLAHDISKFPNNANEER